MAFAVDDDYALALKLQEEFDYESALTVEDDNTADLKKMPISGVAEEYRSTPPPVPSSLIDSSWELIDPNPDARTLFLEFNDKFFWGSLGGVEVRWSPRMTLCAGVCVYEGRGGMCSIRLSEPLLKLRPRKDLVETLLHEMIHAYLFVTDNDRDRDGHGPQFLKHMHRLNKATGTRITVYHSFHDEVDNYHTHWWRCDGPCQSRKPFFGYVKRAMNRVPSSRDPWWSDHQLSCGGTFTKIKEPEDYGVKKSKRAQQDKKETSDKTKKSNQLANWLQATSSQPNDSSSGKGMVSIAKGSSVHTSGNAKTVSAAAGAPGMIDVGFISDDELLCAVDELEKNFTATQQQKDLKSNDGYWDVHGKTEDYDDDIDLSSRMGELPESPLKKPEFPGKGVVLGQKSSTVSCNEQLGPSSIGQVLRRLPGIGLIEVRSAQSKVGDAEIREFRDAGESTTQRTNNSQSDGLDFQNHIDAFSQKLPENDKNCTVEDRSKPNRFISQDTEYPNVENRKSSNTSSNTSDHRRKQPRKNSDTGFHKAKNDIRFWLNDKSRGVGEVVRIPNFTSVGNPRFHKVKKDQENACPSLKIPRQWEDKRDTRPAKKIRLDNEHDVEIAASSGRQINGSERNRAENGTSGINVVNIRGRNVENSRKPDVENSKGRKADNNISIPDDSRGIKVDKDRTMNVVNSRDQNVNNICGTNVDDCIKAVDVSRAVDVGNGRTDSLVSDSEVKPDCITLCSDDSDFDETQTMGSIISRIKASVSIDDDATKEHDGGSSAEGIASVEAAVVISSSATSQNSSEHLDVVSPNHVPCPACGILVSAAAINEHLDLCLS